jgi:hypothetical protein
VVGRRNVFYQPSVTATTQETGANERNVFDSIPSYLDWLKLQGLEMKKSKRLVSGFVALALQGFLKFDLNEFTNASCEHVCNQGLNVIVFIESSTYLFQLSNQINGLQRRFLGRLDQLFAIFQCNESKNQQTSHLNGLWQEL